MLMAFGQIAMESHAHADTELTTLLHRGHEQMQPQAHLLEMLQGVIEEAAYEGGIRGDIPARELASYCLHALAAARALKSKPAVRRLVEVTLAGLRS
jgi:hypothetical protein